MNPDSFYLKALRVAFVNSLFLGACLLACPYINAAWLIRDRIELGSFRIELGLARIERVLLGPMLGS